MKGMLNTRSIFEHIFQCIYQEQQLPGNFHTAAVIALFRQDKKRKRDSSLVLDKDGTWYAVLL